MNDWMLVNDILGEKHTKSIEKEQIPIKIKKAREFIAEVQKLAVKHKLPFFCVTDGASGMSNNGCEAVAHARRAHERWEKKHKIDPKHDWSEDE